MENGKQTFVNPKSVIDHDCDEVPENNDFDSDSADNDDDNDDDGDSDGGENQASN